MDKRFTITVQGVSKEGIEIVALIFVLGGSVVACAVNSCLQYLFLQFRLEAARMRN